MEKTCAAPLKHRKYGRILITRGRQVHHFYEFCRVRSTRSLCQSGLRMHFKAKRLTGKHTASKMFRSLKLAMKPSLRLGAFAGTILLCITLAAQPLRAQTPAQPEREQLLNGLRLLFFPKPGSPELVLKLRINSGA